MTDTKNRSESQQQKWSQLAQRAATDQELKRRLLADPAPVLEAEGIDIPAGSRIQMAENNGRLQCFIDSPLKASAAAAGELSGDQMANIVGGTDAPKETVTFEYGALQVRYTQQ
jgi:hypothetical protein